MTARELFQTLINDRKRLAAAGAVCVIILAIILVMILKRPPSAGITAEKEFTAGKAMQVYIHNRGNDAILRSSDPAFTEISDTVSALLSSIEEELFSAGEWIEIGPGGLPPGSERPGNVLEDVKDNEVGVSVWYMNPATLSTSMEARAGGLADSQGFRVLNADRVLVILSGTHRGLVLLRPDSSTNRYTAFLPGKEALRRLVETVRNSASEQPPEEAEFPQGPNFQGPETE